MMIKRKQFIFYSKNVLVILAMLGLILGLFPSRATADDNPTWYNGMGSWASNGWNTGALPGTHDTAHIEGGPVTLGSGLSETVGGVVVVGGTLIINGEGSLITQGGNNIGSVLDVDNQGTITVTGSSGFYSSTVIINSSNATDGIFNVEDGTANILSGGYVQAANGAVIGDTEGNATLNVNTRGILAVPSLTVAAEIFGGTQTVNFNDATLSVLLSHASTPLISGFSPGQLSIGSGGLTIDSTGHSGLNGEIDSVLSGGGPLYITDSVGGGTITLAADNTNLGAITIKSGGTLQLGNGTLTGGVGNSTITDNGTLVFNEGSFTSLSNTITGTGSLVQNGPGGVDLSGTVNVGSTVINNNSLTIDGGSNSTLGNVSVGSNKGTGELIVNGGGVAEVGTLTLGSGNNPGILFDAGTVTANQILLGGGTGLSEVMGNGGTLIASMNDATLIAAGISVEMNNSLTVDLNGKNVFINSTFNGIGPLNVEGGGQLTLTNTNPAYSGTTTIGSGTTLQLGNGTNAGMLADITNNSALIFNEPGPGQTAYASAINGSGTLTQMGPGTVILNGANNSAGSTDVNGGSLLIGVDATLSSPVTVHQGGELQGYGTIIGNVANDGGIVSPADAIGTLTINGNYTQTHDGSYIVQVDSSGDSDLLVVDGTATLNGTIQVNAGANGFRDNYLYTVLTATGGVANHFTNTDVNSVFNQAFLQSKVFYDLNMVQFEIDYNAAAFMAAAQTPNQRSVANYILTNGSTTTIQSLIASINNDAQFQAAMDQISGATYANQSLMLARIGNWFSDELSDRFDAFPFCHSAAIPQRFTGDGRRETCEERNKCWFAAHGAEARINAGQVSGLNADSSDAALGYEWSLDPQAKIGVAAAYNHLSSNATAKEMAHASGDLYQVGLYARYRIGDWLLGAALDAGVTNEVHTQRQIQGVSGLVSTGANYQAYLFSEQARISYALTAQQKVSVSPFIGVINQQLSHSNFSENGNTGFELDVGGSTYQSTRSQLGALVELPMNSLVKPFASVDWEHEFAHQNNVFEANLVGLGGQFRIEGEQIGRNMALVKTGAILLQGRNWNVVASYEGSFGNAWQQNGGTLQANILFD